MAERTTAVAARRAAGLRRWVGYPRCAYIGPRAGRCRRAAGVPGERHCYAHRRQLAWTAVYREGGRP